MELSELTAYAEEKYHIREQHKWADFPGFSVLCHPQTGKWAALLMRQWDSETGREIQRCDLKCGRQSLAEFRKSYLTEPLRMHGPKWIGVIFDDRTEPEVVFHLFDLAAASGEQRGYTIVLDDLASAPGIYKGISQLFPGLKKEGGDLSSHVEVHCNAVISSPGKVHRDTVISSPGKVYRDTAISSPGKVYRDTAVPSPGSGYRPEREAVPEQLRRMRRLFEYGRESQESRAGNFLRQGLFMQDYEDDYPWSGDFVCYFPTYQDLTTRQLRGYFSWRTHIRRGEFSQIADSAAYIYIYELLNGIGAASPEESMRKLEEFDEGYLASGIGGSRMRQNLRRWMMEFAVVRDLPPETARKYADPEMLRDDEALAVLQKPKDCTDEEVFEALCRFGGKKPADSPVVAMDPVRGRHLFSEAWRTASANCRIGEKNLFTLCFGKKTVRVWRPLANAVYFRRPDPEDRDYILDACRTYRRRRGTWKVTAFDRIYFDRSRFRGFLREADRRLRRYLAAGRSLQEKPEDAWAAPYIDAVIEAEKEALAAAGPVVTIDLSGLDRIREDAMATRDSLLTEEDLEELESYGEELPEEDAWAEENLPEEDAWTEESLPEDDIAGGGYPGGDAPGEDLPDLPLDSVQIRILQALLAGEPVAEILRSAHLMPSLAADTINELMFDEIGDTVLECEDDRLSVVEDYREDLAQMLGAE